MTQQLLEGTPLEVCGRGSVLNSSLSFFLERRANHANRTGAGSPSRNWQRSAIEHTRRMKKNNSAEVGIENPTPRGGLENSQVENGTKT
jgi:hypothetical protein